MSMTARRWDGSLTPYEMIATAMYTKRLEENRNREAGNSSGLRRCSAMSANANTRCHKPMYLERVAQIGAKFKRNP